MNKIKHNFIDSKSSLWYHEYVELLR